jgi:uncharacterized repeat protein (TIGR03803 family)
VFKLTAQGNESVLWSFGNGNDGFSPSGGLIMDKSNNFYGETGGGAYFEGTVFSLTANGSESILWNLGNPSDPNDGRGPTGGLIMDKSGNLYGTTGVGGVGGYNSGTVFEFQT